MSARDDRLSHAPFAGLDKALKRARRKAAAETPPPRPASGPEQAAPPTRPPTDRELLAAELATVRPLGDANVVGRRKRPPPTRRFDPDEEARAELLALVSGEGPFHFDLAWSDEHVEGLANGVDRRLLRDLRKGRFAVRSHLDLHGLTRAEARPRVDAFLAECRKRHERCVLIVHGRGLNSEDRIPVLKEALKLWLTRGPIARLVLAFCSALPTDGGLGAVYVLLRK